MITLQKGRPLGIHSRQAKEVKVYDYLDSLNIEYDRIDHNELMTMEGCEKAEEVLGTHICKNLFLRNQQKTKFYLLMMPGNKRFLTKELTKQINSARLSFAEAEFMEKYLGVSPGSVTVLGLLNDTTNAISLLIDKDLLKLEYIGVHPCVNTSTLKIRVDDLLIKFLKNTNHSFTTVELTGE